MMAGAVEEMRSAEQVTNVVLREQLRCVVERVDDATVALRRKRILITACIAETETCARAQTEAEFVEDAPLRSDVAYARTQRGPAFVRSRLWAVVQIAIGWKRGPCARDDCGDGEWSSDALSRENRRAGRSEKGSARAENRAVAN